AARCMASHPFRHAAPSAVPGDPFPTLLTPRTRQKCRQADESREGVNDDIGGNARKVRAQATLVLEPFAKRAGRKSRAELRDDAAGDVDAPARAEREREIAGDGSEHGAEHVDRLA